MKIVLDVSSLTLTKINNLCIEHDLELDAKTMEVTLMEIKTK